MAWHQKEKMLFFTTAFMPNTVPVYSYWNVIILPFSINTEIFAITFWETGYLAQKKSMKSKKEVCI
jgi:hypothetical protein